MKRKSEITVLCGVAMLMLVSCKPTENNYRSAYEVAQRQKENQVAVDAELGIPEGGLIDEDGPQKQVVDGDAIMVMHEALSAVKDPEDEKTGEGKALLRKYVVAVSGFKMPTNSHALAHDLRKKGYKDAMTVKNKRDTYYAIIGSYATIQEAKQAAKEFAEKHRGYNYVSLGAAPVVVEGINLPSSGIIIK